jgi:hypothetical protein
MCPDGTADGSVDQNVARNDVMAEAIKVASTSLLGLTVGCAQCHDHRYDPVSQSDYYRLRAIFEPAYDVQNWRVPNGRLVSLWSAETRKAAESVDAELAEVARNRNDELDKIVNDTFERELQKLPSRPTAARPRRARDRSKTSELPNSSC